MNDLRELAKLVKSLNIKEDLIAEHDERLIVIEERLIYIIARGKPNFYFNSVMGFIGGHRLKKVLVNALTQALERRINQSFERFMEFVKDLVHQDICKFGDLLLLELGEGFLFIHNKPSLKIGVNELKSGIISARIAPPYSLALPLSLQRALMQSVKKNKESIIRSLRI